MDANQTIVIIILQNVHMLNHFIVHLKLYNLICQFYFIFKKHV